MDGKETAKRKQVLEGNAFYEIDLPEHLGGLKKGQQPHPQLLLLPHPQPLLFHPPQQNRRIRTSQQSEL